MVLEVVRLIAAALAGFFAGSDGVQGAVWSWWIPGAPMLPVLFCAVPVVPLVRKWYEREAFKQDVGLVSRTKQSFREEADINTIMRRYLRTGILESQARGVPRYGDFTSAEDYHACMTRVRQAEELFMTLPAEVRDHVDNDPRKLLDLVFDPSRVDEARELGLIPELKKDEPAAPAAGAAPEAGAAAPPPEPTAKATPGGVGSR